MILADITPVLWILLALFAFAYIGLVIGTHFFRHRKMRRMKANADDYWDRIKRAPLKSGQPDGSKFQRLTPGKALFPREFPPDSGISLGKE